ncbi:MAG: hypothetical protein AVDCRST_MAG42-1251, partial [uncultured Chthoniobacterales bacterium]
NEVEDLLAQRRGGLSLRCHPRSDHSSDLSGVLHGRSPAVLSTVEPNSARVVLGYRCHVVDRCSIGSIAFRCRIGFARRESGTRIRRDDATPSQQWWCAAAPAALASQGRPAVLRLYPHGKVGAVRVVVLSACALPL